MGVTNSIRRRYMGLQSGIHTLLGCVLDIQLTLLLIRTAYSSAAGAYIHVGALRCSIRANCSFFGMGWWHSSWVFPSPLSSSRHHREVGTDHAATPGHLAELEASQLRRTMLEDPHRHEHAVQGFPPFLTSPLQSHDHDTVTLPDTAHWPSGY